MLNIEQKLQKLSQRLELPPEALGHSSQLLLSGTHQLTVEGHRGIALYDTQRIEIRALKGTVILEGTGLQVAYFSAQRLCIRGQIHRLSLEGGE